MSDLGLTNSAPESQVTPPRSFKFQDLAGLVEDDSPVASKYRVPSEANLSLVDTPVSGVKKFMGVPNLEVSPSDDSSRRLQQPSFNGLESDAARRGSAREPHQEERRHAMADVGQDVSELPVASSQSVCPMCGEEVDQEVLENFLEGRPRMRMRIKMEEKFCRAHKERTAKDNWTARGYPDIDWKGLNHRIRKHHQFLEDLFGGAPSHFRGILEESVISGKHRTLKQAMMTSDDSLTPGYYGSKGQAVMSRSIMKKFSGTLRRIAVSDRLVAARGVPGYVQAVLVPELAVKLIEDDMDVDAEKARDIMKESISLGDLVNEEAEDVVTRRAEDE